MPEVFQWLLVPVQSKPEDKVGWEALRLMATGELAVRASTRLRREELLVTSYGSTRLRMDLDRIPLWQDHVEIRQLADHYSKYTYLQRVEDPSVIAEAVRDGVGLLTWETDTFAYAESYDEEKGRYLGLRAGATLTTPLTADSPGLVCPAGGCSEADGCGGEAASGPRPWSWTRPWSRTRPRPWSSPTRDGSQALPRHRGCRSSSGWKGRRDDR